MLSFQGPKGQKAALLSCLPSAGIREGTVWELREQKEGKATKQTVPQAWLLVMSELRAQRRDHFSSVILPCASEIKGRLGRDSCRLPRSPPVRLPLCSSPPRLLPLPLSCSAFCAFPLSLSITFFFFKANKKTNEGLQDAVIEFIECV